MQDTLSNVLSMILQLVAILISITLHESAHGLVSYKLGDDTAKLNRRISLNPFDHINPIGFILLIVLMIVNIFLGRESNGFFMSIVTVLVAFSFAKPVPVSGRGLKNPKRDMALIALAGPLTNIAVALICAVILKYVVLGALAADNRSLFIALSIFAGFLMYMEQLNVGLAVFNLVPIPPLDGSKIVYAFLPNKILYAVLKYERFFTLALFILLMLNILDVPLAYAGDAVIKGINFLVGLLPPY